MSNILRWFFYEYVGWVPLNKIYMKILTGGLLNIKFYTSCSPCNFILYFIWFWNGNHLEPSWEPSVGRWPLFGKKSSKGQQNLSNKKLEIIVNISLTLLLWNIIVLIWMSIQNNSLVGTYFITISTILRIINFFNNNSIVRVSLSFTLVKFSFIYGNIFVWKIWGWLQKI